MSTIGFVTGYHEKTGMGRNNRPYTLYSFQMVDKDGNKIPGYFQCGFDKPACKDGDYIKVDTAPDGNNFKVTVPSIKISKNAPAMPKQQAPASGGGQAGYSGGGNREDVQNAIQYQSSRKDALHAVELLLANDALKLVKADTKAGAASRFDVILAAIDKLTVAFYNDVGTLRKLESVADVGVVDLEGDGDLPDSEDEEEEDDFDNLPAAEFEEDDEDEFE